MADSSMASTMSSMSNEALSSMAASTETNMYTNQMVTQLNAMTDLNSAMCTMAGKVGSLAKSAAQGQ